MGRVLEDKILMPWDNSFFILFAQPQLGIPHVIEATIQLNVIIHAKSLEPYDIDTVPMNTNP
jgi:hypothetical protein